MTMLPKSLIAPLQDHLRIVERTHEEDLARGFGAVYLPYALERKYPNAKREWIWQYVFPSRRCRWTPAAASCAATTCTRAACKKPCGQRPGRRKFPRR